MSMEVQSAFNNLILVIIAVLGIAMTGFGLYIRAYFNRRTKAVEEKAEHERKLAEEDLKDREQKRKVENARLDQEVAKAQADAAEAKLNNESIQNLTSAMLQLIQSHSAESHATRGVLTNQAQSIGDMVESVEKMATVVNSNTTVTRNAGVKVDQMATSVDQLYNWWIAQFPAENTMVSMFEAFRKDMIAAIDAAIKKHDTGEIKPITNLKTSTDGGELPGAA